MHLKTSFGKMIIVLCNVMCMAASKRITDLSPPIPHLRMFYRSSSIGLLYLIFFSALEHESVISSARKWMQMGGVWNAPLGIVLNLGDPLVHACVTLLKLCPWVFYFLPNPFFMCK